MKSLVSIFSKIQKFRWQVLAAGALVTLILTTFCIFWPHTLGIIDNKLYDICLKLTLMYNSYTKTIDNGKSNSDLRATNDIQSVDTEYKYSNFKSVIVDIDEYSLNHFGQWPWPRYHFAELVTKIHDAGATAIGIDILFAEPDRTSLIAIQKALKETFNVDINFTMLSPNLMDNDILLSKAINQASATLGYYFNFQKNTLQNENIGVNTQNVDVKDKNTQNVGSQHVDSQNIDVKNKNTQNVGSQHVDSQNVGSQNVDSQNIEALNNGVDFDLPQLSANIQFELGAEPSALYQHLFKAVDLISPTPILLKSGNGAGFMNTLADEDGVLRRTPLFISLGEKIYPQLALSTILNSIKTPIKIPSNSIIKSSSYSFPFSSTIKSSSYSFPFSSTPIIKISSNGVESITVGDTVVPLENNGSLLLNYRGPSHTFPYISAGKILQNKIDTKELKDKIVFIGSSAAGLKDIRISPFDKDFPGVEVHATIADNILKGDFISRPDWAPAFESVLTFLCGVITTLIIGYAGPLMSTVFTATTGSAIFITSLWVLENNNIWISPLFPLLKLAGNFVILNLVKYGLAEKDKKFYRSAFGHYVSKSVVDKIIESPEEFNLEGEEKEITILFSDIRNFSSISEKLSPSQVSRLLHDYFTPVTRLILNHQGTLDKFIGDAIMCFWNAPQNVENHKHLALTTAIKMLTTVDELSVFFEREYKVKIKTGIGLHSGVCRVGNMGSDDLFDYTAIGDHVNVASRLEGLTKFYGLEILFSESMIPDNRESLLIQYVDRVRVKGKTEPINIYTAHWINTEAEYAAFIKNELNDELDHYHRAIELYKNRNFESAFEIFVEFDKTQRGKKKLYSIYKQRAWEFINAPPDNRWDGVFNHTEK